MEVIVGKQGNQRIPITDEFVSRKHCKITSNGDGTYTIENMSQNGTFVDGRKILKTKVSADTVIQLGPNFAIKVSELLPVTRTDNNPTTSKEYSLKPLEEVWLDYHDSLLDLQSKQHKLGLLIRIPMFFTVGGGVLTAVIGNDLRFIALGFGILGLLSMIYGFIKSKNFVFAEEKDKLDRVFIEKYVCPNPECHHFLGFTPYNILCQDKTCRYCHCKYNSK